MNNPNHSPPPYSSPAVAGLRVDISALSDTAFRTIQAMIEANVESALAAVIQESITPLKDQINEIINGIAGLRVDLVSVRLLLNRAMERINTIERDIAGLKKKDGKIGGGGSVGGSMGSGGIGGGSMGGGQPDRELFGGLEQNRRTENLTSLFPPLIPLRRLPSLEGEQPLRSEGLQSEELLAGIRQQYQSSLPAPVVPLMRTGDLLRNNNDDRSRSNNGVVSSGEASSRPFQSNNQRDPQERSSFRNIFGPPLARGRTRLHFNGTPRRSESPPSPPRRPGTIGSMFPRECALFRTLSLRDPVESNRRNDNRNVLPGSASLLDPPPPPRGATPEDGISLFGVRERLPNLIIPGESQDTTNNNNNNNQTLQQRLDSLQRNTDRVSSLIGQLHQRSGVGRGAPADGGEGSGQGSSSVLR